MIEELPYQISTFYIGSTDLDDWILDRIRPYLSVPNLIVNAGESGLASLLAEEGIRLHMSDPHKVNRDKLREVFRGYEHIRNVHDIRPDHHDFERRHPDMLNSFHTVIAFNGSEYGYCNKASLSNLEKLLRPEGCLIFLAPAHTAFYNGFPEDFDDWASYNRRHLYDLLDHRFNIGDTSYVNLQPQPHSHPTETLGLSVLVIAQKNNATTDFRM